MSPFPSAGSEQQKLDEKAFMNTIEWRRRVNLERRMFGITEDEEMKIIERTTKEAREKLEKRLRAGMEKNEIFMEAMYAWYRRLKPGRKNILTPIRLKRQALAVCRKYFIIYNNLPRNWVFDMIDDLGMKLYRIENPKQFKLQRLQARALAFAEKKVNFE